MVECHECNRHFHEKSIKPQKPILADEYCEQKVQSEALKLQKVSFKDLFEQLKATRLEPSQEGRNLALLLKRQSLMELPYFDGNILTWARFKNTFEVTTTEGGFSDFENLNR